jgi:hypothetical protein
MATNRTLQFLGYAIGTSPVQITASINDTVVFSGAVETLDPSLIDIRNPLAYPVLFSVDNSDLFPTTFSGSYPMTVTVTGGTELVLGAVLSNYMENIAIDTQCELINASINGTTLTFESATGNVSTKMVLSGKGIKSGTRITGGSGTTWTVDNNQTVGPITILAGKWTETAGNASDFLLCYMGGNPLNSESNFDARTDVTVDGQAVTRMRSSELMGTWTLKVPTGSTATFNLNVSPGNVAS